MVNGGIVPNVMGLGNLPLLPHLCLPRHILVWLPALSILLETYFYVLRNSYIFMCSITQLNVCINTK